MKRFRERLVLRLGSPLVALTYRFLFGRPGALARRLSDWALAWERRAGYRNLPIDAAQWEREYRDGAWSYLAGVDELARYAVVAAYVERLARGGAVLDVGCGEGLLFARLAPGDHLGLDLSREAIALARERRPAARFEVADAERYEPDRRYATIVFNESLYYFRRPLEEAERYARHLEPEGALVVSQWSSRRSRAIARRLAERLRLLDETTLRGRRGAWIVSVYAPPSPSSPATSSVAGASEK